MKLGEAMSILARSVRLPSGNSPAASARNKIEILGDASAIAVGAVLARLGQRAAILAHLVGRKIADIGLAGFDQLHGPVVELVEVVRRVEQPILPGKTQPADVLHDRIDVLDFFFGRVGVVEPQVALTAIFLGQAEVQADALGMADVQVAVRLGRKTRMHAAAELAGAEVLFDDLFDEVERAGRLAGGVGRLVGGFIAGLLGAGTGFARGVVWRGHAIGLGPGLSSLSSRLDE